MRFVATMFPSTGGSIRVPLLATDRGDAVKKAHEKRLSRIGAPAPMVVREGNLVFHEVGDLPKGICLTRAS